MGRRVWRWYFNREPCGRMTINQPGQLLCLAVEMYVAVKVLPALKLPWADDQSKKRSSLPAEKRGGIGEAFRHCGSGN
jgi:hypothetical protein